MITGIHAARPRLDLTLRCRCGHVAASRAGFRRPPASASFAAAGSARRSQRHGHLSDAAGTREADRRHRRRAVPGPLQKGLPLVPIVAGRRSLTPPLARASRLSPSFILSWTPGRRAVPRRDARPAAVPYLRTLRHRTAPADGARATIVRGLRAPRIEDSRLLAARVRSAKRRSPRSVPGVLTRSERAALY